MQPVQKIGLFGKRLRIKRLPCRAGEGIADEAAQIERRRLLHRDGQARRLLRSGGKPGKFPFRQHRLSGSVPEFMQRRARGRAPLGKQCAASQSRYGQKHCGKHARQRHQCTIAQNQWNGFPVIRRAACQQQSRAERARRHPDLR